MLSNIGRAAIKRTGGSQTSTNRFLVTIWQLQQRVEGQQNAESTLKAPSLSFLARRLYATAAKTTKAKPATAKKPATKEAPAKKPATKEPATKEPATKEPATKAAIKAATKAAKKPVKKSATKAAKKLVKKPSSKKTRKAPKKKAKVKRKKKVVKVVLTAEQKLRKRLKALRVIALTSEEPKQKPQNTFRVLFEELATGSNSVVEAAKVASTKFKSASTEELERLNRIANQNKAINFTTYKKWVESHTPDEIRRANLARLHIRRLIKRSSTPKIIKDDRAPKGRGTALTYFVKERFQTGDFANIKATDALMRISEEYKALSHEQRKPFEDAAAVDSDRYYQEFKTVYKHDPRAGRKAKAQA